MSTPQQPELRRTPGRGSSDADSAKLENDENLQEEGNYAPVPEENQPGHRPEQDQDKPVDPARWPEGSADDA